MLQSSDDITVKQMRDWLVDVNEHEQAKKEGRLTDLRNEKKLHPTENFVPFDRSEELAAVNRVVGIIDKVGASDKATLAECDQMQIESRSLNVFDQSLVAKEVIVFALFAYVGLLLLLWSHMNAIVDKSKRRKDMETTGSWVVLHPSGLSYTLSVFWIGSPLIMVYQGNALQMVPSWLVAIAGIVFFLVLGCIENLRATLNISGTNIRAIAKWFVRVNNSGGRYEVDQMRRDPLIQAQLR